MEIEALAQVIDAPAARVALVGAAGGVYSDWLHIAVQGILGAYTLCALIVILPKAVRVLRGFGVWIRNLILPRPD